MRQRYANGISPDAIGLDRGSQARRNDAKTKYKPIPADRSQSRPTSTSSRPMENQSSKAVRRNRRDRAKRSQIKKIYLFVYFIERVKFIDRKALNTRTKNGNFINIAVYKCGALSHHRNERAAMRLHRRTSESGDRVRSEARRWRAACESKDQRFQIVWAVCL